MNGIKLRGTGRCVPANTVTNDDLSRLVDTNDEWITARTGIRSRYRCEKETLTELCFSAAQDALLMAGITPADIGVCIVLAEQEAERQRYAEQITRFCEAKGLFPQVMQYDDQERFFETAQKDAPTNAVIALSGVAGLNAAEHLRSLCPACRMIWCSDLDFSLHAFRLRADYFLLEPVSEEAFRRGLNAWIE